MMKSKSERPVNKTKKRAKPGTRQTGKYYRIEVRPKSVFTTFRYQDVGDRGRILRLAGKRTSGSWDDAGWLIEKDMAHVHGGRLVADDPDAKKVLKVIGPAVLVKGDNFKGHPRKNVPEDEKPTPAQRRAQKANIKKAQEARHT